MTSFVEVFFAQGEDAEEFLELARQHSAKAILRTLDSAGTLDPRNRDERALVREGEAAGRDDVIKVYRFQRETYLVCRNERLGYVCVERRIVPDGRLVRRTQRV